MRIKESEKTAFIDTIDRFIAGTRAKLLLFGSRANDAAKGGDIDLLLIVADNGALSRLLSERPAILAAIKARIGDQRIDLSVSTPEKVAADPFFTLSLQQSCLLREWL